MGERTSYPPGTFSWSELVTSDADAAKAFYSALFGWEYDDMPVPDSPPYSMAKRDGQTVAALYPSGDQPPHWNCYVTVESADEAAAKAKALGANVLAEPFDVMDAGRMAVIADPTGAVLNLWQAGTSIGATLVNTPGALTWNDLLTPDIEKSATFYGELLGWTTMEVPTAHGYRVIRNGERANGGMMPTTDAPPMFMPYFGHEDVEKLLGEVAGLGGKVMNGPVKMPQGTIAVLGDPQGAMFAVWAGEYET
jgi:predicted enzyme related to lactoylglutathione lyase